MTAVVNFLADDPLAYYANRAALFPIPYGSKEPWGIVASFAHDWSKDPAQWALWRGENPNCNFGVVAGPTHWLIVDIDVTKIGKDAALQAWKDWCQSNGLPVYKHHVVSARGGGHIYFELPPGFDVSALRQIPLIPGVIDLRVGNGYVVAAGSFYNGAPKGEVSGRYTLEPDALPPYPAPAALLEHCKRITPERAVKATRTVAGTITAPVGTTGYDPKDTAELIHFMDNAGAFTHHDHWVQLGMALKLEYGEAGLDLWRLSHDGTVTDAVETAKWSSFKAQPTSGKEVTLASIMKAAHKLEWKGQLRRTAAAMFAGIAEKTVEAPGAVSLIGGRGAKHAELWTSIIESVPVLPRLATHPEMPDIGHPLRDAINRAIPAIMAEPIEYEQAHAVICRIHEETAKRVAFVSPHVMARVEALEAQEKRAFAPKEWARDLKGGNQIERDNLDNVEFYLNSLGAEIRWNAWLERVEVKGWLWPQWTRTDDTAVSQLRMEASRTGTRFVMGKEFAADALLTLAHRNKIDPALKLLDKWQAGWNGGRLLDTWLSRACGVDDNPYHRAVGRTILTGLVGRIRHPGIKFDLMLVLVSEKQGTEKSSLAKVLAIDPEWFIENLSLGEESKELVLKLAGKTVAEVTEMRTRGDVEAAKSMVSTTHDEGRTAYGRFTTKRARRNILIGSTNKVEFLEDPSGNRRFLPVNVVGTIDLKWVKANLPQLIGEACAGLAAVIAPHNGEKIELPPEVWDIAGEHQEAARVKTVAEDLLSDTFDEYPDCYITLDDVGRLTSDCGLKALDVRAALGRKGFESRSKYGTEKGRAWLRGNNPKAAVRFELKLPTPYSSWKLEPVKPAEATAMPRPATAMVIQLPPLPSTQPRGKA